MKMPEHSIPDQPNTSRTEDIIRGAQQTPNNAQMHFETTDPGYTMDPGKQGLHRNMGKKETSSLENLSEWAGQLTGRLTQREMAIAGGLLLLSAGVTAALVIRGSRKNKKDTTWRNPALHRPEGA